MPEILPVTEREKQAAFRRQQIERCVHLFTAFAIVNASMQEV